MNIDFFNIDIGTIIYVIVFGVVFALGCIGFMQRLNRDFVNPKRSVKIKLTNVIVTIILILIIIWLFKEIIIESN